MRHLFRRISRIKLAYASRLLLYSFFIPFFLIWLLSQLFGEWIWPLDTIGQFQFQMALGFLFFAIIFHLAARRTGMHLATISLIVIFLNILPLYQKPPAPICTTACKAEPLRIVQYNVFYENHNLDGVLKWAAGDKDVDIMIFHEIPRQWQRPLRKLKAQYPYNFITTDANPYDMAVFSRIPLSQRESWGGDKDRNVAIRVHGVTPKENIPFQIYAVHVASPVSLTAWKRRNSALRFHGWQLRDFAQANQIMVGDLNTTRFSAWWRRLQRVSGLKDAQEGFGLMPTWSFFEETNRLNGIQIDHMLVSPGIYVEQRKTLADYGSDHLPVYTKMWLYK